MLFAQTEDPRKSCFICQHEVDFSGDDWGKYWLDGKFELCHNECKEMTL